MGTDGQSRGPEGRRRARRNGPGLALALLAALALSGQAGATHPSWFEELKLNVDGDRARELVRTSYDVSSDHRIERGSITATDTCGGKRVRVALVPAGAFVPRIALKPPQLGRPAVGLAVGYRRGPQIARVAGLRNCRLHVLLAVSASAPTTVLRLEARNDSARFPGREVVVVETRRDSVRRTFFRYAPARGRYLKYRSTLSAA